MYMTMTTFILATYSVFMGLILILTIACAVEAFVNDEQVCHTWTGRLLNELFFDNGPSSYEDLTLQFLLILLTWAGGGLMLVFLWVPLFIGIVLGGVTYMIREIVRARKIMKKFREAAKEQTKNL